MRQQWIKKRTMKRLHIITGPFLLIIAPTPPEAQPQSEPVQAVQAEPVPAEPVQAVQTEPVPAEPVQAVQAEPVQAGAKLH